MLRRLAALSLVVLGVPAVALAGDERPAHNAPAPVPSGMELLYNDRLPIGPDGEPLVAMGLMSGQGTVTVRARSTVLVDFYEGEVQKRTTVRAGAELTVRPLRARPAVRKYFVDVEGVAFGDSEALELARAKWRGRGYDEIKTVEEGTTIGIDGRVIDNRELRLWLPVSSAKQAQAEITRLHERHGERAFAVARLAELPWAELEVKLGPMPLGRAVSFVRFTSVDGSPIDVDAVEFGKGYAWAGKERRAYHGELYAVVDPDGKLAAVNVVGAESLLEGVVPSEIFASAHLEALKAQAVAARNQLFAKLGRRHHDDPFHLCSEQHCQVYSGIQRDDPRTHQAIVATHGEVLFRKGRLVDTVYSSSCGGHTEDNDVVWGNKADPALRGRPDFDTQASSSLARFSRGVGGAELGPWVTSTPATYCSTATQAKAAKFRWEKSFTAVELSKLLSMRYPNLGPLVDAQVDDRGHGGRAMALRLVGRDATVTVLHELPIRQLFGNLNSGTFVLHAEHDADGSVARLTFRGAGWGHGVGMCQMGAIGRAEHGHGYRDILGHYYNDAAVERIYGTSTAAARPSPRPAQRTKL